MKFKDINYCLRCNDKDIVISYPIIQCKKCTTVMATNFSDELENIRFMLSSYHIDIRLLKNKTYVNISTILNCLLPINITEEKLKLYLTFS